MENNERDIFIACSIGDIDWLKRCVDSGTTATITDMFNHEGLTPLHIVAKHKYNTILDYILEHCHNIDVNVASQVEGDTSLHFACQEKNEDPESVTVKLLLNKRADTNLANKNAQTPLHVAAENGQTEVVHLLLMHGADDTLMDINKYTPLGLSKLNGHYKCTRLLHALHWARQKDLTTLTKIHVQKTLREQKRVQLDTQQRIKEQENEVAYKDWLSNKKISKIAEVPQKCSQRRKEKASSSKIACQTCYVSNHVKRKKEVTTNKPAISKIEISLNQADHNIHGIGKPHQLYPYSNYPPKRYRKHHKNHTTSRPSSSMSGATKQYKASRPSSKMSVKSMPTPQVDRSTPSPLPTSFSEYCIHKPDNNIHEQHTDRHDDQEQHHDDNITNEIHQQEDELEGEGSNSSIDGLMFHEVGPENDLQTLVSPTDTTNSSYRAGSPFPSLSAAEILQMLRISQKDNNNQPRLHRRHSTGSGKHGNTSHRYNQFSRTISLNAIPEGEVVTSYGRDEREEGSGSRVFDEKLLASLMPYAFSDKQVSDIEDKPMQQQDDGNTELTPDTCQDQPSPESLKVLSVAWDSKDNAVKIITINKQQLSPRPPPSPPRTQSPTTHAYPISTRKKPVKNFEVNKSPSRNFNVLKTQVYKFGVNFT